MKRSYSETQVFKYVTEDIKLVDSLSKGKIDRYLEQDIKREAIERLYSIEPILKHILEIKIVSNPRRNFINVIIKKEYLPLIYYERLDDVYFCFFVSDKLEPYVIITALHKEKGRLINLNKKLLDGLEKSITNFKKKFGISNEGYHYTSLSERNETEINVSKGNISFQNKSHSKHWHLKMRIATGMYIQKLPILNLFDFSSAKEKIEPVQYNYSRETVTWESVLKVLESEINDEE